MLTNTNPLVQAFAKFAMILAVVNDMLGETALAAAGLEKLKEAFSVFTNNTQIFPLVYECKSTLPLLRTRCTSHAHLS